VKLQTKSKRVREIGPFPKFAGVYLLFGQHYEGGAKYYIGESNDIIRRVLDHRRDSRHNLRAIVVRDTPLASLQNDHRTRWARQDVERRFISAALLMKLPVLNTHPKSLRLIGSRAELAFEIGRLETALKILSRSRHTLNEIAVPA
jgi:hypothetical protein